MLGAFLTYLILAAGCLASFVRPFWALMAFYFFVYLDPIWNWRWALDLSIRYQLFLGICLTAGVILNGLPGNSFTGVIKFPSLSVVLFIALVAISNANTIDPSFSSPYFSKLWRIILVTLIALKLIATEKKAISVILLILTCQAYNALQINLSYFELGKSVFVQTAWGTCGDNNLYSNFTIPCMAIALGFLLFSKSIGLKLYSGLALILQSHQLMLLESRGAMIGALLLAVLAIAFMPKTKFNIASAVAIICIVLVLAGPSVREEFLSAFERNENLDSSASSRFAMWRAGWLITQDYPFLGVGPHCGQILVPVYAPELADNHGVRSLHNLFFEVSTGCGIPALFAFLAFFAYAMKLSLQRLRSKFHAVSDSTKILAFTAATGIPSYFLASCFSSGLLVESIYGITAACIGGLICSKSVVTQHALALPNPLREFSGSSFINNANNIS